MRPSEISLIAATISKHDTAGIIAIIVAVVIIGFGMLRSAIRFAMFIAGIVVAVIGVLLLTRAI